MRQLLRSLWAWRNLIESRSSPIFIKENFRRFLVRQVLVNRQRFLVLLILNSHPNTVTSFVLQTLH
jgi:hypothetical protein